MAKKSSSRKSAKSSGGTTSKRSARTAKAASRPSATKPPKTATKKLKKSPLSRPELSEFRKMLMDKRRALIGDMNGIEAGALRANRQEGSGDLSNMPTHPADIGTDNFEQEFTLGLLESERAMLTEINEAIERIDVGTYGICVGTGDFIGKARLKARPWAKYCIEYARMLEKGLVRPGEEQSDQSEDDEDDLDDDELEHDTAEVDNDEVVEEGPIEDDED